MSKSLETSENVVHTPRINWYVHLLTTPLNTKLVQHMRELLEEVGYYSQCNVRQSYMQKKFVAHTWFWHLAWEINDWTTKFPQWWDDMSDNEFLKTFVNNSLYKVSGATSKITCKILHKVSQSQDWRKLLSRNKKGRYYII